VAVLSGYRTKEEAKAYNRYDIFEESHIKESVSNRVANLLNGNKLPYMKRSRKDSKTVIINTGILNELYKYGLNDEQLPNLKALADELKAVYDRDTYGAIIKATFDQIKDYVDVVEGDEE
jgi:hypothetical protein